MKRKWIAAAALLLLLPALLGCAAASMPQIYGESYYAELSPMTGRLYNTEGRRLILIGGSSVAFGVDAPLLERLLREQGFDYTVCPYGLYAAVGASAMLSLSEGALRAGDTVVLAFEPSADTLTAYFGATAFLKCAETDGSLFFHLNDAQRRRVIGNYLPYIQEKYGVLRSGSLPRAEGVYAKAAFDENCNMIYPRPGNQMALGYDTAAPIVLDGLKAEPAFADQVNAYCQTAAKKGAAVYMSFSPMNRSAMAGDVEEGLAAYFTHCNETFACPIISDPRNYVMDSGWFYDNNFHLNSAGAQVRTYLLAQDLLAQWGCYTAVDYELPAMPALAGREAAEAADTGDFLFELDGNGGACIVSGLTAQGASKMALRVPSAYQGKPVAAFRSDALTGAEALEELRVPQSVEALPDGLLSSCPGLRRLVLEHTGAPCGLAAHSLDGLEQLKIFVPAQAYPYYRDGVGCAENPWQPYLNRIFTY